MRVGFTGTRRGLTSAQRAALFTVLARLRAQGAEVLVSGACEGADREAWEIWTEIGGRHHFRPGDVDQHAWAADRLRPRDKIELPVGYLERNREIAASEVVVATPGEDVERVRSGTWATVRAARRYGSTVLCVLPSGEVRTEAGSASPRLRL